MTSKKFLAGMAVGVVAVTLALTACSSRPPDCSDPETLDTVRQIIVREAQLTQLLAGRSSGDLAKFLAITEMRATGYDENIKKYSCAARLTVPFGDAEQHFYTMPLEYDSQTDASGHIAVVGGLYPGNLIGIASAISSNLKAQAGQGTEQASPAQAPTAASTPAAPDQAAVSTKGEAGNVKADDYAPAEAVPAAESVAASSASTTVDTAATPSPSFDCAKAESPAEHLICSDTGLAALDAELAQKYKAARNASPDPAATKAEQVAWVKNVRDASSDVASMSAAYRDRIAALAN